MVFSSLNFLFLFFPVVMLAHMAAPMRLKNIVLLIASIFFYAWGEPVYVGLMLLSIAFNYVAGLQIFERRGNPVARRHSLILSVAVNLLILGFFKYYGFVIDTINAILPLHLAKRELALPIGISFYTFQALSYVIDVYRDAVDVQRNVVDFATYITMFPQLVAGPIIKYADIQGQLRKRSTSWLRCGQGAERMLQGVAKKVLLANNLGMLYTAIQSSASRSMLTAWLGAIAYTLQIYFDFSGYSDMAIGMGRILGFDFMENFNYPYVSASVTEFWRRWHISLSSWFRDYVYIPLGGSRVAVGRHILNLLIVWLLTGLWHGANWNFVLWGLYYGLLLILEKTLFVSLVKRLPAALGHVLTLLLVMVGWVIFSNTEFAQMWTYLGNLFGIGAAGFADGTFLFLLKSNLVLIALSVIFCMPAVSVWFRQMTGRKPVLCAVYYGVVLLLCIASLVDGSYNPFLYFRF